MTHRGAFTMTCGQDNCAHSGKAVALLGGHCGECGELVESIRVVDKQFTERMVFDKADVGEEIKFPVSIMSGCLTERRCPCGGLIVWATERIWKLQ